MICGDDRAGVSMRHHGFSLVEVVVALGIVTFCLVAIIGLLPVGLNSVKDSREEGAAAVVMEQIAGAIRNARSTGTTNFSALAPYTNIVWAVNGSAVVLDMTNLTHQGVPASSELDRRLRARIQLEPPTNVRSEGRALVSVAWPDDAQWNASSGQWTNAQGSLSTWVIFLPRP